MSQANELLESLSQDEIATYAEGTDAVLPVVIGKDRIITVPASLKKLGVQRDNNVEIRVFECPRYWNGFDISKATIYINYILPDNQDGQYVARNITAIDDETVQFTWIIEDTITQTKGNITFLVCAKKVDLVNTYYLVTNIDPDGGRTVMEDVQIPTIPSGRYAREGVYTTDTNEQVYYGTSSWATENGYGEEIEFVIRAEESESSPHWNSEICRDFYISEGMECSDEPIVDKYPDVITRLLEMASRGVGQATAEGGEIFGDYDRNIASRLYAHAEGELTEAGGHAAHTEGLNTKAMKAQAHAEGRETLADGTYGSHAEGYKTKALSRYSHAEGINSIAGEYDNSSSGGLAAHSEGNATQALGNNAHSEGKDTVAKGSSSHSEGRGCISEGTESHAEGSVSKTYGTSAHAEGEQTEAHGKGSHSEGSQSKAYGEYSHAAGRRTEAHGNKSATYGQTTKAYADNQFVVGQYNARNDDALFIVGNGTKDTDTGRSNAFEVLKYGGANLNSLPVANFGKGGLIQFGTSATPEEALAAGEITDACKIYIQIS